MRVDSADAELALHALREAGMSTTGDVVSTPEEFTAFVQKNWYDVILADYKLPNWNGINGARLCAGK